MLLVDIDGAAIDFEAAEILSFRRTLDLATGELARSTLWALPGGRELEIAVRRVVPIGAGSICISRSKVRPVNFSAPIRVLCPVALSDPADAAFYAEDRKPAG